MAKTLLERAERIRDETSIMRNTHDRVGGVLVELVERDDERDKRIKALEEKVEYLLNAVGDILLQVSPQEIEFTAKGGTETVAVKSFIDWVII